MRYVAVLKIIGFLLMLFSVSVIVPVCISLYYDDGGTRTFLITGLAELTTGFVLWFLCRNGAAQIKTRDGFLVVALVWFILSAFAAIPFYMAPFVDLSLTDSYFEAVSGLTTTGASIIPNLEQLPHAMLFYRQELQFLGGMGIVVLAVAVLPMLGIGGMQLYRAETPGNFKGNKLTPRIAETAKALWLIYIILTVLCAVSYWLAGMDIFHAVGESFSTIATGGFSMHTQGFAFYHSNSIYMIAIVYMFLSGVSFALHFSVFQQHRISLYLKDVEFRYYVLIIIIVAAFTISVIASHHIYSDFETSFINGLFSVMSMVTTTGFKNSFFSHWPTFIPIMLMCVGIIGACGGSTAGGIKVMRFVLICKQSMREMRRLIHPNGVYLIKFGEHALPSSTINAMWGFISVFIAGFVVLMLLLMATGMNMLTAFSSAVDSLANVGAGIGDVAQTFQFVGTPAKWILCVAMIAGRLEIFTLLLLFTPAFWRK